MSLIARTLALLVLTAPLSAEMFEHEHFRWDAPDETVPATLLDNPNYYDADIVSLDGTLHLTWLEFLPGEGDRCRSGVYHDGRITEASSLNDQPLAIRHPTFKVYGAETQLTYEYHPGELERFDAWRTDTRTLPDPSQKGRIGRVVLSDRPMWSVSDAVADDGLTCVAWDRFEGDSYDVHALLAGKAGHGKPIRLASTSKFEGRPSVAVDARDRFWIAWEEGSENWGRRYVPKHRLKGRDYFEMSDANGPLHRFRRIRLAMITRDGKVHEVTEALPMPAFELAARRENLPDHVRDLGVFYERPRVAVDAAGRVWVVYRHYYVPYVGHTLVSHQQAPWGIYARCLTDKGWSKLYRFDIGQGDQMQRLEVTPHGDGIALVWTTGRTDRRENTLPRGICVASVAASGGAPGDDLLKPRVRQLKDPALEMRIQRPKVKRTAEIDGTEYEVLFGDFHRHTDLSLCFVPTDGSIEDAYRYGMDVVRYDFLGITDHCRDIDRGDALSQLWWRCMKEVTRYSNAPKFIPYFAYERSRGGEDHNVISLRADMLRNYTYPHAEFWKELDDKTITIPHQTICAEIETPGVLPLGLNPKTWEVRDDEHRPLMEVYQGCRDRWIQRDAHAALESGQLLGFIASSDHLSTDASFACVWSPERDRETIFAALKARRTYAASDKIRLLVRAGDHWMGEQIDARNFPPLDIDIEGTAPIKQVEIIVDGQVEQTMEPGTSLARLQYSPKPTEGGRHWLYVRVLQVDGNQAWASPIWIGREK